MLARKRVKSKYQEVEQKFHLSGALTRRRMWSYLVIMLLTNISTKVLSMVDGLVVGNFVGPAALAAVSIFTPILFIVGVLADLISNGAAASLSVAIGKIDQSEIQRTKDAIRKLLIVFVFLTAVIQIPIVKLIIDSYHLSPEMDRLVTDYAKGMMISLPFGLISCLALFELEVLGKMKVLVVLSGVECITNLVLDLFFVGVLGMGTAGAGYGTAVANVVRASISLWYLYKKTNVFDCGKAKASFRDMKHVLKCGMPECANGCMMALQSYVMMRIILSVFHEYGGTLQGICAFSLNLALILINSITGSVRPVCGLIVGAKAWKPLHLMMRQAIYMTFVLVGALVILLEIRPQIVFQIHGFEEIPEGGLLSVRLFCLHLVFTGIAALFRLYYSTREESVFATITTITGYAALPVFAYILNKLLPPPWIWFSYFLTETLILMLNWMKYSRMIRHDLHPDNSGEDKIYMSVLPTPENAVEITQSIYNLAKEHGYSKKLANHLSICMEEMVSCTVKVRGHEKPHIQIIVGFSDDHAEFVMFDDGECNALIPEQDVRDMIVASYNLLRKLATTVEYQYVLNLNYSKFTFSDA